MKRLMMKNRNVCKACAFSMVALSLAGGVMATEYFVKDGTTDWTKAENFYTLDGNGVKTDSTVVPGEASDGVDIVCINTNEAATINTPESLAVVNRLARIRPMNRYAKVYFDVPANTTWTNDCPIHWDGINHRIESSIYGQVYKQGAGTLELSSKRLENNYTGSYDISFNTYMIVEGGKLILPQTNPLTDKNPVFYCLGFDLKGENTTLVLLRGRSTYPKILNGVESALVTNAIETISDEIDIIGNGEEQATYNGRIQGVSVVKVAANQTFTNPQSTYQSIDVFNRHVTGLDQGVLTVPIFGMAGMSSPLGTAETVTMGYSGYGAKLVYSGTEDGTTDKTFQFYAHEKPTEADTEVEALDTPLTIDAGAHGGVTFTGAFRHGTQNNARDKGNKQVILCGDNEKPCIIKGVVSDKVSADGIYALGFEKRGTGTWRFADTDKYNTDRFFSGAFWVKEGTLQFDSLARKYDLCSVGLSTNRFKPYTSRVPVTEVEHERFDVDWAFGLGGDGTKEGALEYTGTNDMCGWSRPIGILGNARFKNDTAWKTRYLCLTSEVAAASTLTLEGSGLAENEVADVIDTAEKPISVVKKGSGKWVIGGDLAFHGNLEVKGGELVVRKYAPKYTWYRLNCKSKLDPLSGYSQDENFCIYRFGVFNEAKENQILYLKPQENYASIEPGEAAIETNRKQWYQSNGNRAFTNLFNYASAGTYGWYVTFYNNAGTATLNPVEEDPTTHIAFEFRLREDAPDITAYDMVFSYGTKTPAGNMRHPKSWTFEGSVDGLHWDLLHTETNAQSPTANNYWVYGGTYVTGTTTGQAIAAAASHTWATLDNVSGVSVAPGATLTAEGEAQTLNKLTIDAATGAGTIKNFALATSGVLKVTNFDKTQDRVTLGITAAGSTALDNLSGWGLWLNGDEDISHKIVVRGGQLQIAAKGTTIFIR